MDSVSSILWDKYLTSTQVPTEQHLHTNMESVQTLEKTQDIDLSL